MALFEYVLFTLMLKGFWLTTLLGIQPYLRKVERPRARREQNIKNRSCRSRWYSSEALNWPRNSLRHCVYQTILICIVKAQFKAVSHQLFYCEGYDRNPCIRKYDNRCLDIEFNHHWHSQHVQLQDWSKDLCGRRTVNVAVQCVSRTRQLHTPSCPSNNKRLNGL